MATQQVTPVPHMAQRFPLMEKPLVGFLLAFAAGSMDAFTLFSAKTFATVQSGNVVSSGYWLVEGNWSMFGFAFGSVLMFGLGSMFAGIVMTELLRKGKLFSRQILLIEAFLLAIFAIPMLGGGINPHYIAFAVSFVAGMQGNAFHKTHGMLYGNVAVTFVVQMAFNFLVQSFFNKKGINGEPNLLWSGIFFLVLLGFCGGGGIGALLAYKFGVGALWLPTAVLVILAITSIRDIDKKIATDPTGGGLIA